MQDYTVKLLDVRGAVVTEFAVRHADDDAAIDYTGALPHRGPIALYAGERLVGQFAGSSAANGLRTRP